MYSLVLTETLKKLVENSRNWENLQYEQLPQLIYAYVAIVLMVVWVVITTVENILLHKEKKSIKLINRSLHRKLDEAEEVIDYLRPNSDMERTPENEAKLHAMLSKYHH